MRICEVEVEAAAVETGDPGADRVPFNDALTVGVDRGVVGALTLDKGDVIPVVVVGELGGVEVEFEDAVITMPDVVGEVGITTIVPEVVVLGGEEGVTTVVVGALEGDERIEPMTLVSDAMMLERRLPRPVLLVAAAGEEAGVVIGVTTPVEAEAETPVLVVAAGGSELTGGRRELVNTERIDETGSVPTTVVAAAEDDAKLGLAGVVTGVETAVGVGVGVGSSVDRIELMIGTIPAALDDVDVGAAAVAVDPPLPENVTPDEAAALELGLGLEELDVVPPVKIPLGPKVIPPIEADEDEGAWTVVAAALLGDEGDAGDEGAAAWDEEVGRMIIDGTTPLEAAAEGSSKLPKTPRSTVELAADVGPPIPTVVV